MTDTASDWDKSAAAWIAHVGDAGDTGRGAVLDLPMLAAAQASHAKTALDVGCGEGRFCRMMSETGIQTTGLDPTRAYLGDDPRQADKFSRAPWFNLMIWLKPGEEPSI